MAQKQAVNELSRLIASLQAERKEHEEAIAQIDETFATFGITSEPMPVRRGPGRPPKKTGRKQGKGVTTKKSKRGGRGKFAKTGEQSVYDFVQSHGNPSAKQVNEHWAGEGRGGKADNTLGKLVNERKLKRVKVKGERGSRYQTV